MFSQTGTQHFLDCNGLVFGSTDLKIKLLSGLFLTLAVISLAGCSAVQKQKNVTEIEFWTLQLSDYKPYITGVIQDYEHSHPGIKIKWIDVPFSEGEKRALAAVISKKVPDVINMNPSFASTLASRGALADVKKYISKKDYDSYLKESWDASTLKGFTFGIPWYITSSITIYNKDLIKKAGLSPDKPPKTFNEMANMAKTIKAKTGKYAFLPNLTEDGKIIQIFNKYSIPILDKTGSFAVFNTDEAVKVMDMWANLYQNNYIPPESLTETHQSSLEKYEAGENTFIMAGANFLKKIKQNAPDVFKQTDVAPQITGSNGKVDFALMNLVIPIKSPHPKEATDFAIFLTNDKNQLEFCKLAPILPSRINSLKADFFSKPSPDILDRARVISAQQLKKALRPVPTMQNQKDLFQLADYATQQVLLGEKTSKQALDEAVNGWNKILKDK